MVGQGEAQVTGRVGERWFQSILPAEWHFEPPREDVGLDGTVLIGTKEQTGGFEFRVQIKASAEWSQVGETIAVAGIRRETVKYWCSRQTPVMVVLYDLASCRGYYAWAPDVLPDPRDFLLSKNETITLHVPLSSRLDRDTWPDVESAVQRCYEQFVADLEGINAAIACLSAVSGLVKALRLLELVHFAASPTSKYEDMSRQLSEVVAHRDVVTSLTNAASGYLGCTHLGAFLSAAAAAYRAELEAFVDPLESLLTSRDHATAILTNRPVMEAARPRLIGMVTEIIGTLSGAVIRTTPGGVRDPRVV